MLGSERMSMKWDEMRHNRLTEARVHALARATRREGATASKQSLKDSEEDGRGGGEGGRSM